MLYYNATTVYTYTDILTINPSPSCFDAVAWVRGRTSACKNSFQHPLLL